MGVSAALVYPTTLAIITATFRDRRPGPRRSACGARWGVSGSPSGRCSAATCSSTSPGAASSWHSSPPPSWPPPSAWLIVPDSRDAHRPALDLPGLALSVVMLGSLVYTIIEAPDARVDLHGDDRRLRRRAAAPRQPSSPSSCAAPTRYRRHPVRQPALQRGQRRGHRRVLRPVRLHLPDHPLLPAGAGQTPLTTGVRVLPVAVSIAVGSVLGTRLAVTWLGTKAVVTLGLLMLAGAFGWVATIGADVAYGQVAAQMVLLGTGLGLTTAPATESIMGVVPPEQAGAGSALNDATRQVGGTLGVAVLGSIYSTLYLRSLDSSAVMSALPAGARQVAGEGVAQGLRSRRPRRPVPRRRSGPPWSTPSSTGCTPAASPQRWSACSALSPSPSSCRPALAAAASQHLEPAAVPA